MSARVSVCVRHQTWGTKPISYRCSLLWRMSVGKLSNVTITAWYELPGPDLVVPSEKMVTLRTTDEGGTWVAAHAYHREVVTSAYTWSASSSSGFSLTSKSKLAAYSML